MKKPRESAAPVAATEKICQSCGLPIGEGRPAGTDWWGGEVADYCNRCFYKGEFIRPYMTAPEMQSQVKAQLLALGTPLPMVKAFARRIPTLRRWRVA